MILSQTDRMTVPPIIAVLIAAALIGVVRVQPASAQSSTNSDQAVFNRLLTESVIRENGRVVCEHAATMEPHRRYDYLRDWVLPSESRRAFRFNGYFTRTNPISNDHDTDPAGLSRLPSGGELRSPALELIRTALATNQLTELLESVKGIPNGDIEVQRGKVSMLTLGYLAQKQPDSAKKQLEQLYQLVASSEKRPMSDRWPELVVSSIAVKVPELRGVIRDLITSLQVYQSNERTGGIATHLNSNLGGMRYGQSSVLKNWHPVSRVTNWTRGTGRPSARWHTRRGRASLTSSHYTDYLFYQIPLLGDYEVECDLSNVPYELGHISVAGRWLHLANDGKFTDGSFQGQLSETKIEPKLASRKAWTKYRAVVRNNQVSTYISGRLLTQRQIDTEVASWVALMSNPNSLSSVRNIRITGNPTIPDTVYPLREGYGAWQNYDNEQRSHWWIAADEDREPVLNGRRVKDFPPRCQIESLLIYQRPVLEDGEIEYEFKFVAGQTHAHPALDRIAFLLEPEGVRLHAITDGKHEYDETVDASEANPIERFSAPLTLKENDWNQVRLSFRGSELGISLNGDEITQFQIPSTNQRTLGLFHFSNQSNLLVRKLEWTGQWPKQLPSVDTQELAMPDHEALVDLNDLTEQSTVLISRSTSGSAFSISRGGTTQTYQSRGIQIDAPVDPKGWHGWQMTGSKRYYGDLDVTLEFSGVSGTQGTGQADFSVSLIDDLGNKYGTSRGFHQNQKASVCSKLAAIGPDGTFTYTGQHVIDETSHGRLRILRRGDMVHSYIAHGDSRQFHHVFSRPLLQPDSPHSVRVEVMSMNGGQITVTLESLVIRGQSEDALKEIDRQFTALDRFTKSFRDTKTWSFATLNANEIAVSNSNAASPSRSGLMFDLSKQVPQKDVIMAYRGSADGDFLVSAKFSQESSDADSSDTPFRASLSLILYGENDSESREKVFLTVKKKAADDYHVTASTQSATGDPVLITEYDASSIDTIKITRIQRTIFFLCSGNENKKMLGYADLGTGDVIPGSIRFAVAQPQESIKPVRLLLKTLELSGPEHKFVQTR